jgi:hypothetical protein
MNRRDRRRTEAQQRAYEQRLQKDAQEKIQSPRRGVFVTPYLNVPDFLVESFRGLLTELADEANQIQPWRANQFSQRAAALHEASHCVVATREGYPLKTAAISQQHGVWLGEFWLDIDKHESDRETLLAHLRITLAGRRGELLFTQPFCLWAGLDELAYALLIVMIPLAEDSKDNRLVAEHYTPFWGTLLAEVDDVLLAHRGAVHTLADQLMWRGRLDREELMDVVAGIPKRDAPPPIRSLSELKLTGIAHDPLAHGPTALIPRDALLKRDEDQRRKGSKP